MTKLAPWVIWLVLCAVACADPEPKAPDQNKAHSPAPTPPTKLVGGLGEIAADVGSTTAQERLHLVGSYHAPTNELGLVVIVRGSPEEVRGELERAGLRVAYVFGSSVVGYASPESLESLGAVKSVIQIRPMSNPLPQIETEALPRILADAYHKADPTRTGAGVRIGVIDTGYAGLASQQLAGELPDDVTTVLCTMEQCETNGIETGSDPHGTACAEIIHDIAPDAELILVRTDMAPLSMVIDGLVSGFGDPTRGVRVISMSLALAPEHPMNGTDGLGIHDAIERARKQGVLFVNSAGNFRKKTYTHTFTDNGHGVHRFSDGVVIDDDDNDFYAKTGETVSFYLTWDEWDPINPGMGSITQDYDLKVSGPLLFEIGAETVQAGSVPPVEFLRFQAQTEGRYYLKIVRKGDDTTRPGRLLRLQKFDHGGDLQHKMEARSLSFPADGPAAFSVAAVDWETLDQEGYSSEGPTANGRKKPDIAGYARVHTASYGKDWRNWLGDLLGEIGFAGTSAAAPHVAGAAALLFGENPDAGADDVAARLVAAAEDRGERGLDNQYGHGLLRLPPLEPPTVEILDPSAAHPAGVGRFDAPQKFHAEIRIATAGGAPIGSVRRAAFQVEIGGLAATVASSLPLDGHYFLSIIPPPQPSAGLYDLTLRTTLGQQVVTRTAAASVAYVDSARRAVDVALVLDRSGSMEGAPLTQAKDAAHLFVDLLNDVDRASLVSYHTTSQIDVPLTYMVPPDPQGPPRVLFEDDFEEGTAQWLLDAPWDIAAGIGVAGSNALTDSPEGPYANSLSIGAELVPTLDTTGTPVSLSFAYSLNMESGYDNVHVLVSASGGPWTSIWTATGNRPLQRAVVGLPASSSLRLRFAITTDSSVTADGWTIDDVRISDEAVVVGRAGLHSAIDGLFTEGNTAIGAGLSDGLASLSVDTQAGRAQAILLMSDGVENVAPYVAEVMPTVVAARLPVFSIGLGAVDPALMQSIADQTSGTYSYAADENGLVEIYNRLSGQISGRSLLFSKTVTAQPATPMTFDVDVDSSVTEAIFSVRWAVAGSGYSFELTAPDGTTYTSTTAEALGASYSQGLSYAIYRVPSPTVGVWHATVTSAAQGSGLGAQIAAAILGTDSFTLDVQAETHLTLTGVLTPSLPTAGQRTKVLAEFSGTEPMLNADVRVEVVSAGGQRARGIMRDDGLEGDNLAEDGIYTFRWKGPPAAGVYDLTIDGVARLENGTSVRRVWQGQITAPAGLDDDGDGMPNLWEAVYGLDTALSDSAEDDDGDGLSNLEELVAGTDPLDPDSDRDGVTDGLEKSTGTDPAYADSDNGGVLDGVELRDGTNPLDSADDAPGGGLLEIDPSVVDFGEVALGDTRSTWIWIRSQSARVLRLDARLEDAQGAPFSSNVQSQFALYPGAETVLNLSFSPSEVGEHNGVLQLTASDPAFEWQIQLLGATPGNLDGGVTPDAGEDPGNPDGGAGGLGNTDGGAGGPGNPDGGAGGGPGNPNGGASPDGRKDGGPPSDSSAGGSKQETPDATDSRPGATDDGNAGGGCGCRVGGGTDVGRLLPAWLGLLWVFAIRRRRGRPSGCGRS